MLSEKAKAARNEYKRQWRKDHPDLIRAQRERYWERKAAQMEQQRSTDGATEDKGVQNVNK